MNNNIYKVLWVDEEESIVKGTRSEADKYFIELDWHSNWEDAKEALQNNFVTYSAIILDANCKLTADKDINMKFLPKVLQELEGIFVKKANELPWYVLSAGGWDNFAFVMDIVNDIRKDHEEEWGEFLYYKNPELNEPNTKDKLFEKIVEVAQHQSYNLVVARHKDAFKYMGEGKLLPTESRMIMLNALSALYFPEERKLIDGNDLRQLVESIFQGAYNYGLLPDECHDPVKGFNISESCKYLGGEDTLHIGKRFGEKKGINDYVLPPKLHYLFKQIINVCNVDSHFQNKKDITLPEDELFFGCALQLCHIISYLGHYVEEHPDKQMNKEMERKCPKKEDNKKKQ